MEISTHILFPLGDCHSVEKKTDSPALLLLWGRFAPEADFEARRVQTELVQRLINRFQRSWTFVLAKIIPQIDSTQSEVTHMHLGAVAGLSVFFPRNGI